MEEPSPTDPTSVRFEGTYAGVFSVAPIVPGGSGGREGPAESEPPRFYRLEVRLDDGRRFSTRLARGAEFDFLEPFSIDVVHGRATALVVLFAEHGGEDCVRQRVTALVLEPRAAALVAVGRGQVGERLVAFDACGDWPDFTFHADGDAIRVDRRVLRIVTSDPPDVASEEATRELAAALEDIRARHRVQLADAESRHLGRERLRALRDAEESELLETRAQYAFEAGRPYLLCDFARMKDDCPELPPTEQSFRLGTRPPGL